MKKPPAGSGGSAVVGRHPHHPRPQSQPGQGGGGSGAGVPAGRGGKHHGGSAKHGRSQGGGGTGAPAGRKHKTRKLALGEGVACCSAEALAASLRLAGHPVTDEQVLALYWLTASGPDDGATILATLEAAAEHGLADVRLAGYRRAATIAPGVIVGGWIPAGPHAITLDGAAAWTWGERRQGFYLEAVDEAWAVTWR